MIMEKDMEAKDGGFSYKIALGFEEYHLLGYDAV
jgi:hypothetical protein